MNSLCVLISSALLAAAFPKLNWWWCAFFALAPFFFALENTKSAWKTIWYGILWSIGYACGMGYWVFFTVLHHYEVPLAKSLLFFFLCVVMPVAVIYTGFAVCYRFLHRNRLVFFALVVPSAWVLAEYVKVLLPFLIPWGGVEYALLPFTDFVQVADILGGYGVMFLVVAINSLLVYVVKQIQERRVLASGRYLATRERPSGYRVLLPLVLVMLMIALPVAYGKYRLKTINAAVAQKVATGQSVSAELIQGNFSTKERWSGMGFYHRISTYLDMSGKDGKERRVIVWPETILNSSSKLTDALFVEIMRYIGKNALLISGGLKTGDNGNDVFNSAYFISGNGRLLRYDKHILLPYSETSPLIDLLDQYYTAPGEFAPGHTPLCVDAPGGRVGASICLEILYSGLVRQSVTEGAVYLVNLSNDSWFGDSAMPYIHLNAARMRAVENRRFLLRASNSGISAIISPAGEITARSGLFTKQRIDGRFVPMDDLTLYTRYGNAIIPLAALILMLALVRMVVKGN